VNAVDNYITKIEFEILSISLSGFPKLYTTSWDAVGDFLLKDVFFGGALKSSAYLNSLAKEIQESNRSKEEMLKMTFEAIKKIKWNEKEHLFTSASKLINSYKNKTGSSAEINIALIQLARKIGLEAHPLVLSTRENGAVIFPSLNKLNYVIAYVKVDDRIYLLDATEEFIPIDLLPKRCLNWRGRLLTENKTGWIDLKASKKDKKTIYYDLKMDENLNLNGKIGYARYDYAALDFRNEYKAFNSKEEYIEDFKKDKAGIEILNSEIENLDSIYLPIKDQYQVSITKQVGLIDGELYIYPLLYERFNENPFKQEDRKYPVDFACTMEESFVGTIRIPETYTIVVLPKSISIKMPDNSAYCTFQIEHSDNLIQFSFKYTINKETFLLDEYKDLREYYNQIIKKHSEPIILKKK
jgi:hypothetical protein